MYSESEDRCQLPGVECLTMDKTLLTVVRERADLLNDQPATAHSLRASADAVVGVFPQQPGVLFMNADGVLDLNSSAIVSHIGSRLKPRQRQ